MAKQKTYGGMAVIEGVMMKGPHKTALAVRQSDGTIQLEAEANSVLSARFSFLRWPLIRGVYALLESLVVGVRMLNISANLSLDQEGEEISVGELVITLAVAIALALIMFVVLPTGIVHFAKQYLGGTLLQNILEGIIRLAVFLAYVILISKMKEITRVFMYHGAEHKSIAAHEAGEELRVENVRKYPIQHPRCGTSFLLMIMIISILVFAFLGDGSLFYRIWSRLIVFPIIAGIGYELIKMTGRYKNKLVARILMSPGLWLQKLTTREPEDDQIEVAIAALQAVLEADEEEPVCA